MANASSKRDFISNPSPIIVASNTLRSQELQDVFRFQRIVRATLLKPLFALYKDHFFLKRRTPAVAVAELKDSTK